MFFSTEIRPSSFITILVSSITGLPLVFVIVTSEGATPTLSPMISLFKILGVNAPSVPTSHTPSSLAKIWASTTSKVTLALSQLVGTSF